MTPKDKAAELIQRYSFGRWKVMTDAEKLHTINICLMVADELADCVVSDLLVHDLTDEKSTEVVQYYYDVLNEIINFKNLIL
jgi:alpha/beta superfamily hydrolase